MIIEKERERKGKSQCSGRAGRRAGQSSMFQSLGLGGGRENGKASWEEAAALLCEARLRLVAERERGEKSEIHWTGGRLEASALFIAEHAFDCRGREARCCAPCGLDSRSVCRPGKPSFTSLIIYIKI